MRDASSTRFIRFHLKTRHLVLLVELGRHASILHAAEAAGLTQPGASKLIGELEHALGVALFERLPRGVVPTWHGKILIRRAGAALAEMDAAHQEIMQGLAGIEGRVRVGSVAGPALSLLPRAVELLKERSPRAQVAIAVEASDTLIEQLRAGELDIVLAHVPAHVSAHGHHHAHEPDAAAELDFEPLAEEAYRLVVRAGHPWLGRTDLALDALAGAAWIVPPPGRLRDGLMGLFMAKGLAPPADIVETMALPLVTHLLAAGDRIAALPLALALPQLDAGTLALLPFDLPLRADMVGIVMRRRHHLPPSAEAMLAALREAAGLAFRRGTNTESA